MHTTKVVNRPVCVYTDPESASIVYLYCTPELNCAFLVARHWYADSRLARTAQTRPDTAKALHDLL